MSPTKHCAKCEADLPLDAFTKNRAKKDGLNHACRVCHSGYTKAHYVANKAYYVAKARRNSAPVRKLIVEFLAWLKDVPCADCNKKFPSVCMDFDHVRGVKTLNLSRAQHNWWIIEQIQEEVMKCEVVCANCHRLRTWRRRGRS